MTINCESCTHKSTCKYKNDFEIFIKEQTEHQEQLKQQNTIPDFISVEYKCIYFCPDSAYYYEQAKSWPILPAFRPDQISTTLLKESGFGSCDDCDFYNNYTHFGKKCTEDSPCRFCPEKIN